MYDLDNAGRILRTLLLKVQKTESFRSELAANSFGPGRKNAYHVKFIKCPMFMTVENRDPGSVILSVFTSEDSDQDGYTLDSRDLPTKDADTLKSIYFLVSQASPSQRTQRGMAEKIIRLMKMHPDVPAPDRTPDSLPPLSFGDNGEPSEDDPDAPNSDESSEDDPTATHAD